MLDDVGVYIYVYILNKIFRKKGWSGAKPDPLSWQEPHGGADPHTPTGAFSKSRTKCCEETRPLTSLLHLSEALLQAAGLCSPRQLEAVPGEHQSPQGCCGGRLLAGGVLLQCRLCPSVAGLAAGTAGLPPSGQTSAPRGKREQGRERLRPAGELQPAGSERCPGLHRSAAAPRTPARPAPPQAAERGGARARGRAGREGGRGGPPRAPHRTACSSSPAGRASANAVGARRGAGSSAEGPAVPQPRQ